jgi:hypothetical protein
MPCYDQILLLNDERSTWKAWESLKQSARPGDEAELMRLQKNAEDASVRLRDHLKVCTECKKP